MIPPPPSPTPGPIALLSDLHGNLVALEAVLNDLRTHNPSQILCLGDMVGYGPDPAPCVRHMRDLAAISLLGNHELMMLTLSWRTLPDLGPELTPALQLALEQLDPSDIEWISSLPLDAQFLDFCIVHGSFLHPANFLYIQTPADAEKCLREQPALLSFHGHTHVPVIWRLDDDGVRGFEPSDDPIPLIPNTRYAINVGSVGQPRDGNPLAAYTLYDPHHRTVRLRRIPYDIPAATSRFLAANMRPFDAHRIASGD